MTVAVACFGIAVHDLVFRVPEDPVVGSKNFATSLTATSGGPAVNAAKAISDLGGWASVVAVVGDDAAGDAVVSDLDQRGVDTRWIARRAGAATSVSSVMLHPDGERTIVNATSQTVRHSLPRNTADAVRWADAVLVDVRWMEGALAAAAEGSRAAKPVVVDFDLSPTAPPLDLLDSVSHVVFSLGGLGVISPHTAPADALMDIALSSGATPGVTMGPDGSVWIVEGDIVEIPAFDTNVVNTLGAGDVFHGAFALAVGEGRPTVESAIWASAAAALFCSLDPEMDTRLSRSVVNEMVASR